VKIFDLIFAARPMLLLPVWSIFIVTRHVVMSDQPYGINELLILIGETLIFAGAYFLNQITDYESDLINKKLGFLQRGYINKKEMICGYVIVSIAGLTIGVIISLYIGLIFSAILILGLIYSAPPLRLKDRPIGGFLANIIAYGVLVPLTVVTETARPFLSDHWYLTVFFFLTVGAIYLLTIIPDREGDLKTGKMTMAKLLSDRVLILIGMCFLVVAGGWACMLKLSLLCIIGGVSFLLYLMALIVHKNDMILLACKTPILLLSLLAGYYFPLYIVFLIVLIMATRLYYQWRFNMVYPRLN
jgi:4-hydroxybenzoate polyprenyltransferase